MAQQSQLTKDIRILQILRIVGFLLGAAALIYFIRERTTPVIISYLTRDRVADIGQLDQVVYLPAIRNLFDAPLGYMAALALAIPGLFALHRVTRGQEAYEKRLKKGADGLKWLELAVGSAIMIEIVCLLSGVSDLAAIKVAAGLLFVTCGLGWLSDQQNQVSKTPHYSAYLLSIATGVLPWIFIVGNMLHAYFYGAVNLPWYSYALAGAVLVGSTLYAVNQLLGLHRYQQWKQNAFVERNFLLIDLVTKLVFAVILIVGLKG